MKIYDTIIVGAGAAGLYCAAQMKNPAGPVLLLEKTEKIGTKLLMSGGGQCNLTHGGNIKDFLSCYGEKGTRIRTTLYAHNNQKVCDFFEELGVNLTEREDGKVFPVSMDAHEVRDALLKEVRRNGVKICIGAAVSAIEVLAESAAEHASGVCYRVFTINGNDWYCRNLVIACGGCSYPTTGSDGSLFSVLERDLGLKIVTPLPALTPVFVENYVFAELSGISFQNTEITIADDSANRKAGFRRFTGDLLLTHRNLSGPVILNNSRYMKTGTRLAINFVFPYTIESMLSQMKKEFSGNARTIEHWMTDQLRLPKRFCEVVAEQCGLAGQKASALSGEDMKTLAGMLCQMPFAVSGLGGFRQAMVTAGGVSLDELSLKTMEAKRFPGLYVLGEAVDIDGDTGGYNLQFAFASAAAAVKSICSN